MPTTLFYTYFPLEMMTPVFDALAEKGLTDVVAFGFGVAETDKHDRLARHISVLAANTSENVPVLREDKPALTAVDGVAGAFSLTVGRTMVDVYMVQEGKALPALGSIAEAVVLPQSRIAVGANQQVAITDSYESPKLPKRLPLYLQGI